MQFNFGNMHTITAMALQSPADDTSNHVTEFTLQYSYGGFKFLDYMEEGTETQR